MRAAQPDGKYLAIAMEVFARGFAYTRSFTHPYHPDRVEDLWVLRDGPRKNGDYRNEEYVAHNVAPAEVNRIARETTRGRFAVCVIHATHDPDVPLREGYKELRYRLMTTEPFMVQPLKKIPQFSPPEELPFQSVQSRTMADKLTKVARSRQVLPEHLHEDASMRQYVALVKDQPVGWVRSISVRSDAVGHATWCSNMFVLPRFRRRGIARAMLSRMLRDDRAAGSTLAVLLSSHTGALLYPLLGYRQIGTLLMFTPPKKR